MSAALAARPRMPVLPPPRVERLLYMCDAARLRDAQGVRTPQFHAYCRGRALIDRAVRIGIPDRDGRFRAGLHVCVCACHQSPECSSRQR